MSCISFSDGNAGGNNKRGNREAEQSEYLASDSDILTGAVELRQVVLASMILIRENERGNRRAERRMHLALDMWHCYTDRI